MYVKDDIKIKKWSIKPIKHQLSRFASLIHNIYILTDPTRLNVDPAAHAGGPTTFAQRIVTTDEQTVQRSWSDIFMKRLTSFFYITVYQFTIIITGFYFFTKCK